MTFSVCKLLNSIGARYYYYRRFVDRTTNISDGDTNYYARRCIIGDRNNGRIVFLLIFVNLFLSVTDACSGRSTPKPKPIVISSTPRPNITFHTYACPPMHASWYCLNGATCFTVKIGEHTLYNCECADGYMGRRCEFKDLDSSYVLTKKQVLLETASIAFGATLAILLVVVVCASLYIRYSRLQKQNQYLTVTTYVDGSDDRHSNNNNNNNKRKPFARRIPATVAVTTLPIVTHHHHHHHHYHHTHTHNYDDREPKSSTNSYSCCCCASSYSYSSFSIPISLFSSFAVPSTNLTKHSSLS